jgi:5-methylcytosine-specific restriction endonuclease McrA
VYATLLQPLPLSVQDSLLSYGLLVDPTDLPRLLEPVFASYIAAATAAPPEFSPGERGTECEICGRDHLPLTYHHLIPRSVHAKVLKRGWHKEWELNRVAWLCRACHSFVHRIAGNEELARTWFSVELLMEREDVVKWAGWISKIRWKKT